MPSEMAAHTGNYWPIVAAAQGGTTVLNYNYVFALNSIPSSIGDVPLVLLNLGVNDMGPSFPTEAAFMAAYEDIIEATHAKWPDAILYLAKPWKSGFDAQANTMAGWIDNLVAAYAYVEPGMDERVWIKGSDNGVSETTDGVHYSAFGIQRAVEGWRLALGY